jgi:alkylresorcinol/alkylpyrone synthase
VETPSLTFRPRDQSMQNVISSLIFGDGAAAAVMCGRRPPHPSVSVIASRSLLHPQSYHAMGFRVASDGFQVILSPEVPDRAPQGLRELVTELCGEGSATPSDLTFFAIHPGGRKVLENVQEALGLDQTKTRSAWKVLTQHGNMSSPTALFVLDEELRSRAPVPGSLGLLCGFGPGFAVELALLRAEEPR